jgi:hypothetical protein
VIYTAPRDPLSFLRNSISTIVKPNNSAPFTCRPRSIVSPSLMSVPHCFPAKKRLHYLSQFCASFNRFPPKSHHNKLFPWSFLHAFFYVCKLLFGLELVFFSTPSFELLALLCVWFSLFVYTSIWTFHFVSCLSFVGSYCKVKDGSLATKVASTTACGT